MAVHYVFNAVLIAMRQHSLFRVYPAFEWITVKSLQMFTGIWNITVFRTVSKKWKSDNRVLSMHEILV